MKTKKYKNRHNLTQIIKIFIDKLCLKYGISSDNGVANIHIYVDKHFADRCMDRSVEKDTVSKLLTRMIRGNLCKVLYSTITNQAGRVNIKSDDGWVLGITGYYDECKDLHLIKVITIFNEGKEDNPRLIKRELIKV